LDVWPALVGAVWVFFPPRTVHVPQAELRLTRRPPLRRSLLVGGESSEFTASTRLERRPSTDADIARLSSRNETFVQSDAPSSLPISTCT